MRGASAWASGTGRPPRLAASGTLPPRPPDRRQLHPIQRTPRSRSGTPCSRPGPRSRSRTAGSPRGSRRRSGRCARAARRCIASSSWWPCAMSDVSTATDRDRRSRPGRDHTSPHATRVMKSWKSAVSSVVFAIARSTCASESTSRRTRHALLVALVVGEPRTVRPLHVSPLSFAGSASPLPPRRTRAAVRADAGGIIGGRQVRRPRRAPPPGRRARLRRGRRSVALAVHFVMCAPDGEQWHRDVAQQRAHVVGGERLAAQGVALVVGILQGVQQPAGDDRIALDRAGSEPALRRPGDQRRGALRAHLRGARRASPRASPSFAPEATIAAARTGPGCRSSSSSPTAPPSDTPA